MPTRSYNQLCGLAVALDRIGDRWTLLVIRELAIAPRRYTELREALPGIATNLLSDRLRTLEQDGIIRRSSPSAGPGRRGTTYELTDVGRELEPVLLHLVRWGFRWIGDVGPTAVFRSDWLVLALRALLGPIKDTTWPAVELRVDGQTVHAVIVDGEMEVRPGVAESPDMVLTTDLFNALGLAAGMFDLEEQVRAGQVHVIGTTTDRRNLRRALLREGLRPPVGRSAPA